jgi:hypothetical protein
MCTKSFLDGHAATRAGK